MMTSMRIFLMLPLLIVATAMMVLLPSASALIARDNFDDNHYTYISLGGVKVCGDHLCKPGEWNQWITKLMNHQLKSIKTGLVYNTPSTGTVKNASYESPLIKTANGHLSNVITQYMGNGQYSSFVSVSNDALLKINHIVLSQETPNVNILKAWIGPNWHSSKTTYDVTFDSAGASLDQGQEVNIVVITDGAPSFTIDSLSGN